MTTVEKGVIRVSSASLKIPICKLRTVVNARAAPKSNFGRRREKNRVSAGRPGVQGLRTDGHLCGTILGRLHVRCGCTGGDLVQHNLANQIRLASEKVLDPATTTYDGESHSCCPGELRMQQRGREFAGPMRTQRTCRSCPHRLERCTCRHLRYGTLSSCTTGK
jgi:hypothetical protein